MLVDVQRRRGCITSDRRLESAFDNWAVNGEGFIQFDAGAQKWKALSPSAEMIKDLWNGYEARNYLFGQFINGHCPEMIHQIKLRKMEKSTGELEHTHVTWGVTERITTAACKAK